MPTPPKRSPAMMLSPTRKMWQRQRETDAIRRTAVSRAIRANSNQKSNKRNQTAVLEAVSAIGPQVRLQITQPAVFNLWWKFYYNNKKNSIQFNLLYWGELEIWKSHVVIDSLLSCSIAGLKFLILSRYWWAGRFPWLAACTKWKTRW